MPRRPIRDPEAPLRVLGYIRVSTDRQEVGPEVQADALRRAGEVLDDWELELRWEDSASASSMNGRPVLQECLADLRAGRADMLAVSKLDRLSRSVADFSGLLRDAEREGWHCRLPRSRRGHQHDDGRAAAHMSAVFAQLERERISERTKEALAQLKASGKQLGTPSGISREAIERAVELYALGLTLQEVAEQLNDEAVPTPTGGRWWPDRVAAALDRAAVARRPRWARTR